MRSLPCFFLRPSACILQALFFFLFLAGCSSAPKTTGRNAIIPGMMRRDVVLLMGSPYRIRTIPKGEVLIYRLHKDIADPTAPDEPYLVFIEDGRVTRYGNGKDFDPSELTSLDAQIEI